jgi:tetratricopeptide (TPR) repeat protein
MRRERRRQSGFGNSIKECARLERGVFVCYDIGMRVVSSGVLLVVAFSGSAAVQTASAAAQENAKGWGSSWTQPQTAEEKAMRDVVSRLEESAKAKDWQAVEKEVAQLEKMNPRSAFPPFLRALLALTRNNLEVAMTQSNKALGLLPKEAGRPRSSVYVLRAHVYLLRGDYRAGRSDFEQAIAADRENSTALNDCAWMLATCPDGRFRDGRKAVQLAHSADARTHGKSAAVADTLAAAEAEAGDFREAVTEEKRAIALAKTRVEALRQHLQLFESGQALHQGMQPPRHGSGRLEPVS